VSPVARTRWVTFGCYGTLVNGRAGSGEIRLYDDVESMLAEQRQHGYRLAVLTNCDDGLFEATHRTFRKPFDLFLTAERVRGHKPSLWHFRGFELMSRASRGDWVHVGCSQYHDIAPAKAFGISRVWLDREATGEDPATASAHVRTAAEAFEAISGLFD
jgi:2-haloacid dehalogenase